jgi:hypothetical protein
MDGQERSGRLFAEGDGCRTYLGFVMGQARRVTSTPSNMYIVFSFFSIDITYDTHHTYVGPPLIATSPNPPFTQQIPKAHHSENFWRQTNLTNKQKHN